MKITLYQAADDLASVLDRVDPDTGEVPGDIYEAFRVAFASKGSGVAAYILDSEAGAALLEDHAKDVAARAKRARKRADWLRSYLAENMARAGVLSIKDERGLFTARLERDRDVSVDVFEPGLLPSGYMREVPARHEPDKAAIRKVIEDGLTVPGARLVARDRLTIK